jgi:hypothetical protein
MTHEIVGWVERISLPSLNLYDIEAKIDSGAQTSAMHAENIEYFFQDGKKYVQFNFRTEAGELVHLNALFIQEREVTSSNGHCTTRPVIQVPIKIGSQEFDTQMTLINRQSMKFKILIGRNTLHLRFLINTSESFLLSR